ncbi:MAG: hypothetical protein KIT56_08270 [Gammaproteobacteria bacterium]|nr:hypothetical protein [Gammaproteobacteria bacterium]MCW5583854.1 hypothetical protein [Gammaproteobacteria bacterium]
MPEVLTKYPESMVYILESAGVKCGTGTKQQILVDCPPKDFCSLPLGEICIYRLKDATSMTQISAAELNDAFNQVPTIYSDINVLLLMLSCLFGLIFGLLLRK